MFSMWRKPDTEPKTGPGKKDAWNGVSSTATYDFNTSDKRTTLGGGTGGDGGYGLQNGGPGGRGWAATEHIHNAALINNLGGGKGGAGGKGNVNGGPGGVGEGAQFARDLAPFDWSNITVPQYTIAEFCAIYDLGLEIEGLLTEGGYRRVASLTMENDTHLMRSNIYRNGDSKFKNGHISEIKRALKEFYNDCRHNRVPRLIDASSVLK